MKIKECISSILSLILLAVGVVACSSNDGISVTGVSLNHQRMLLLKGQSERLIATITPLGADNVRAHWTSSDSTVATVDVSGTVRAVGGGNTTITVTTEDGQYTATCEVTVKVNLNSISLSEEVMSLSKGESRQLEVLFHPEDATDKNVRWLTQNKEIAQVDSNGMVTAVGGGQTVIRAIVSGISASCQVNVTSYVQSVSLGYASLTLVKGQERILAVEVSPSDATNKNVVWSSSDETVVSVVNGKLTALKVGTAVITATTVDGNKTADCVVTVLPAENIGYQPYGDGEQW